MNENNNLVIFADDNTDDDDLNLSLGKIEIVEPPEILEANII